ncbi:D-alanyl-D-alanine carboxypeptidase (penicillin-binding protein 5/6) [Acinetobacter calcoaceticus]|uniref:D-alanyl-D-alanine carboxypeptidase (Penicillin-binding protein 5/6) n=1 Tax=Acinetobacter calcoaceticus TaxID=471 RepID=A0A4R1XLN7_ACICA|nr:D-alanyl-D-alanine carboxypeptidase (penicillin-binding protein 5/6) [Acinetobacter calcoaceticus]
MFFSTLSFANLLNINPSSVDAQAWTILDTHTGQTIAEHNSHQQRAPASLTKMMTAYITLKEIKAGRLNKNEILTATKVVEMVQWDESQMYLKAGEQISIDQLLAGLIIMSANDAAVSLAERISGDVPTFVARMNQEAQALGMKDTHFTNPAGITMPAHFSSAHDMARLGQVLTQLHPEYLDYSKQLSFSYNQRFHHATNLLLKIDPTVDGLKTGFTKAAGYNLTLTASRPTTLSEVPQRRLVVVVLGAKSAEKRAELAHQLLNLAYTYTRDEMAFQGKHMIGELPVEGATVNLFKVETPSAQFVTTSLYPNTQAIDITQFDQATQRITQTDPNGQVSVIQPLTQTETQMKVSLEQTSLTAPVAGLMHLAKVNVYQNNLLLQSFDIEDDVQIEQATWYQRFWMWLQSVFPFLT